jgi:hypothetical protein
VHFAASTVPSTVLSIELFEENNCNLKQGASYFFSAKIDFRWKLVKISNNYFLKGTLAQDFSF